VIFGAVQYFGRMRNRNRISGKSLIKDVTLDTFREKTLIQADDLTAAVNQSHKKQKKITHSHQKNNKYIGWAKKPDNF